MADIMDMDATKVTTEVYLEAFGDLRDNLNANTTAPWVLMTGYNLWRAGILSGRRESVEEIAALKAKVESLSKRRMNDLLAKIVAASD